MKSFFDLREKAVSQQQQKLMGLALAYKRGEVSDDEVSDEVKKMADTMSTKDLEDYAKTKHKDLPKKVDENVEDRMPASPDEKRMAMKQAEFIQYVGREIGEHLAASKEFPEWMQNKLSGLHQKAKDMHATLGAHGEMDESVELDEEQKLFMFKTKPEAQKKAKEIRGKVLELGPKNFAVVTKDLTVVKEGEMDDVNKAVKVAKDMGGNMTGAVKKIEKMKRGLSKHPKVKAALQMANEETQSGLSFWGLRENRRNARSDARSAMQDDPDMKQKFSKNVSATDDDRKAADKNIIVQLRRVSDLPRGGEVEFKNGKTTKVSQKDAKKLLKGFDGLRKGPDKERFQKMAGKDPAGLKKVMSLVK